MMNFVCVLGKLMVFDPSNEIMNSAGTVSKTGTQSCNGGGGCRCTSSPVI